MEREKMEREKMEREKMEREKMERESPFFCGPLPVTLTKNTIEFF